MEAHGAAGLRQAFPEFFPVLATYRSAARAAGGANTQSRSATRKATRVVNFMVPPVETAPRRAHANAGPKTRSSESQRGFLPRPRLHRCLVAAALVAAPAARCKECSARACGRGGHKGRRYE